MRKLWRLAQERLDDVECNESLAAGRRCAHEYRLALVDGGDPEQRRLSSLKWTEGREAANQFSDGFPLLVVSQASLDGLNVRLIAAGHGAVGIERFRPNIVLAGLAAHEEDQLESIRIAAGEEVQLRPVKPCGRCPIPNVDPATAEVTPQVLQTLLGYRRNEKLQGAAAFGMNAIVLNGFDQTLRVGQPFTATSHPG